MEKMISFANGLSLPHHPKYGHQNHKTDEQNRKRHPILLDEIACAGGGLWRACRGRGRVCGDGRNDEIIADVRRGQRGLQR